MISNKEEYVSALEQILNAKAKALLIEGIDEKLKFHMALLLEVVQARSATLFEISMPRPGEESHILLPRIIFGDYADEVSKLSLEHSGIAGICFDKGEELFVTDVYAHTNEIPFEMLERFNIPVPRSIIAIPVYTGREKVGVLEIIQSELDPELTSLDLKVSMYIASEISGILTAEDDKMKDSRTGVKNNEYLQHALVKAVLSHWRHDGEFCYVMTDLDHFKKVNDTFGHLAGDYVLREFAQLISEQLSRPGDLLARYGGEEFGIILSGNTLEQSKSYASTLVKQVEDHQFVYDEIEIPVTVSMGVSSIIQVPGQYLLRIRQNEQEERRKDERSGVALLHEYQTGTEGMEEKVQAYLTASRLPISMDQVYQDFIQLSTKAKEIQLGSLDENVNRASLIAHLLVEQADQALYHAKETGRNKVVAYSSRSN